MHEMMDVRDFGFQVNYKKKKNFDTFHCRGYQFSLMKEMLHFFGIFDILISLLNNVR